MIAFASSFPGSIRAVDITPDRPIVVQKSGFLASEQGVELSVFFQKKGMAGFFGGEGFILQKLSGYGTAFLEIDGYGVEYTLAPGQQMVIDTGNLAMMDATCSIDIQSVKGVKKRPLRRRGPVQHRGKCDPPDHGKQDNQQDFRRCKLCIGGAAWEKVKRQGSCAVYQKEPVISFWS